MADNVWPDNVPGCFILGSHNETDSDNLIRSQMDTGPAKVRRRTSAMPRQLSGTLRLTGQELKALRAFIKTALMDGALNFIMNAQAGDGRIVAKFATPISIQRNTGNTYMVSIALDVFRDLPPLPAVFVTTPMPAGKVGSPYSWTPIVSKGTKPYQGFSIAAGALPTGIVYDAATGRISGQPFNAGTFPFTLRLTDGDGRVTNLPRSLVIAP